MPWHVIVADDGAARFWVTERPHPLSPCAFTRQTVVRSDPENPRPFAPPHVYPCIGRPLPDAGEGTPDWPPCARSPRARAWPKTTTRTWSPPPRPTPAPSPPSTSATSTGSTPIASAILPDRETAAEATGQVFLKAFTALPTYRPTRRGSFRSWLFAIAHNACIDALRRHRPHAALDAAGDIAGADPGPEDRALAADERRSVAALLARLTPDQRRVVELRLAGLTGQEVADALGLSLSAVKAAQLRAYARLRRILAADASTIPRPEDADAPR